MSTEVTEQGEPKPFHHGYWIYPDGRAKGPKGTFLKLAVGSNGYYQVNCRKDRIQTTYLLHRLVAIAFIPNPDNLPEVNHLDGNKLNCNVSNLEWASLSRNRKHAFEIGLQKPSWTGKTGALFHGSKAVNQLDSNGRIIKTFGSVREAQKIMQNKSIGDAVRGRYKTAAGYKWEFATPEEYNQYHQSNTSK